MNRIGITGPTGAGKTQASKIIQKRTGAVIIDADRIGRQVAENDIGLCRQIARKLEDPSLCTPEGLDRVKTARIVFSDPTKLEKLNQIIHPPMQREIEQLLKQYEKERVVLDAAVLPEWKLSRDLDAVLCVTAGDAVRKQRLIEKGMTEMDADMRIKAQGDWKEKEKLCTHVIRNDGSTEELELNVMEWWKNLMKKRI